MGNGHMMTYGDICWWGYTYAFYAISWDCFLLDGNLAMNTSKIINNTRKFTTRYGDLISK